MLTRGIAKTVLLCTALLVITSLALSVSQAQQAPIDSGGSNTGLSVSEPQTTDVALPMSPQLDSTAAIVLSPSATTVAAGDVFTIEIMVDAGSTAVDGVDAYVGFDAGKLRVVNVADVETDQVIADSTSFTITLQNVANNTTGHIDYSAGRLAAGITGSHRIAQVRFKAMESTLTTGTPVTFSLALPRKTDAACVGESVLGATVNASVIITPVTGIPLATGWNLVSIPFAPPDKEITAVLSSITGSYNLVYAYDAFTTTNPWKVFDVAAEPELNTLKSITESMGIWIRTTKPVTLTLAGSEPVAPSIPLAVGWNLVGYPSQTARPVSEALSSIAGKYNLVYQYNAFDTSSPWKVFDSAAQPELNSLRNMLPGSGYWIRVTQACTWSLP